MQQLIMEAFIRFTLSAYPVHVSAPYSKVAITTAQYTSSFNAQALLLVVEDRWS